MNAENNKKLNVDDLNGIGETTFKVITKTIQEPNPVKFSQACEDLFKTIVPETMINYSITSILMRFPQGDALVYVANLQYWGSEFEFNAYLDDLKRANLIIKP